MIGLASAIYPGECGSFIFPNEGIVNWNVQDNSTSLDGFSFTQNETNVTYCLSGDFIPDSFVLTFYTVEGETKVVIEHHYSSGGTRIIYRDRNITVPDTTIIDNTTIDLREEDSEDEEPLEEEPYVPLGSWFASIGAVILMVFLYFLIGYLINKKEEEGIEESVNQT